MAHLRTKSTTRDFTEREKWKWQLVRSLYERGLSKFDIINLFKFIDKMMTLPPNLQQNLESKINQYEEEQKVELLCVMEERGIEKGKKIGQQIGKKIGQQIGAKKTCRKNIIDLLELRFLSVPETLVEALNNIEDLARLERLILKTLSVNYVAEFEELIKENSSEAN